MPTRKYFKADGTKVSGDFIFIQSRNGDSYSADVRDLAEQGLLRVEEISDPTADDVFNHITRSRNSSLDTVGILIAFLNRHGVSNQQIMDEFNASEFAG